MSAVRFPKGAECQCGQCSRFFTSPTGFDFHQWTRGRGDTAEILCLNPALIGMVVTQHAGGDTWQLPGREEGAQASAKLARKALIDLLGSGLVSP